MSVEGSEYVVDEANAGRLTYWLTAGLWTREEASHLFLDIDPESLHSTECFSTFSGNGKVQYEYFDDDDPRSRMEYGDDEDGKPVFLNTEQRALLLEKNRLLKLINKKINFFDSAEPHKWIEHARKKGIPIPWLNWAIGTGHYIPKKDLEKRAPPGLDVGLPIPPQIGTDWTSPASAVVARSEREPRPAATGPVFTMKKAAMIAQHKHEWPTIEQDMKGASRGELHKAIAGKREWKEADAMEWARAKGKLISIDKPTDGLAGAMGKMASLPISRTHTCEG